MLSLLWVLMCLPTPALRFPLSAAGTTLSLAVQAWIAQRRVGAFLRDVGATEGTPVGSDQHQEGVQPEDSKAASEPTEPGILGTSHAAHSLAIPTRLECPGMRSALPH